MFTSFLYLDVVRQGRSDLQRPRTPDVEIRMTLSGCYRFRSSDLERNVLIKKAIDEQMRRLHGVIFHVEGEIERSLVGCVLSLVGSVVVEILVKSELVLGVIIWVVIAMEPMNVGVAL